jgi:cell division protein FtsB
MFDKEQEIVMEPDLSLSPSRGGTTTDPARLQKAAKHRQKAAQLRARIARLRTKIERLKHLTEVLEERAKKHDGAAAEAEMGP